MGGGECCLVRFGGGYVWGDEVGSGVFYQYCG